MKLPTMLTRTLVQQWASDLDLSAERDVQVIERRIEHEGFSFLAITLPTLSDALERGLENGHLTIPSNFARFGGLPHLLGGYFRRVFDRAGKLLDNPCPDAIAAIRQICRFWKKPKMRCSDEMNLKAVARFKEVEAELQSLSSHVLREDVTLDALARILWAQVFPELDPNSLVCCHGPGVTADRYLLNQRYRIREWYTRSEQSFPSDLHAFHSLWYAAGFEEGERGAEGLTYHELRDEPGVRVKFVPKTLSGPRVIAVEPSAMQYMQQGLMRYVVPHLESHRLTCRSLHFTDQTINQSLAYRSSIDRKLATLDLKDASDRVHLLLVQRIFKSSGILQYLEDSRSLHADLPDGSNVILTKFASMGSAMCFPVEAMVFYTLVQSAMHKQNGRRPSSSSIRQYSAKIDIYGDDIIVPVEYVDAVVGELEAYGLKVNVHKSFRFSHFRESCGGDFFMGRDVKPIYAREYPHDDRLKWTAKTVMSWVSTADQFYMAGQWKMAQCIRRMLERVLRRRIPRSRVKTHGVGFASLIFDTDCHWRSDIQGWYQSRICFTPSKREDEIDGDASACFNKLLGTTRAPVRNGVYQPGQPTEAPSRGPELGLDEGQTPVSWTEAETAATVLGSIEPGRVGHPPSGLSGYSEPPLERLSASRLVPQNDKAFGIAETSSSQGVLPAPRRLRRSSTTVSKVVEDTLLQAAFESNLHSSVKRDTFKSKCRWVTVLT